MEVPHELLLPDRTRRPGRDRRSAAGRRVVPPAGMNVEEAVAQAFRDEWGQVVATLIRVTGDWDLAEECAPGYIGQGQGGGAGGAEAAGAGGGGGGGGG